MSPSFITTRLKNEGNLELYKALPSIIEILCKCFSIRRLNFAGYPEMQPISLTEEGLLSYMTWLKSQPEKSFVLLDDDQNPRFVLAIGINGIEVQGKELIKIERLEFPLRLQQIKKIESIDNALKLIGEVCYIFNACCGYAWDEEISPVFQRRKRMWKQHEEKSSKLNLLDNSSINFSDTLDFDTLPALLLRHEFNVFRVPDGIWWINYFNQSQIGTLGEGQVKSAPWFRMIELHDKAIICMSTEEPTTPSNPNHLIKLRQIVEHLNLPTLQEKFKYKDRLKI